MSEDSMGEIYVKVNTKELDEVVKSLGKLGNTINSITSSMAKGLKSSSTLTERQYKKMADEFSRATNESTKSTTKMFNKIVKEILAGNSELVSKSVSDSMIGARMRHKDRMTLAQRGIKGRLDSTSLQADRRDQTKQLDADNAMDKMLKAFDQRKIMADDKTNALSKAQQIKQNNMTANTDKENQIWQSKENKKQADRIRNASEEFGIWKKKQDIRGYRGGGGRSNIMQLFSQMAGESSMFGGAKKLEELEQIKRSGKVFTKEENQEYNQLNKDKAGSSPMSGLYRMFEKSFGTGSKWDKAFGGHGKMAAGAIGGAALGVGVGLIKKGVGLAIESSPMLQQMLKLWKFGIMMLLRPIATFFGMIMRPIMIVLLRKFIIPFYQKFMPIMMSLGNDIGEVIAKILNGILSGDVGSTLIGIGASAGALISGGLALKYAGTILKAGVGIPLSIGGKIIEKAWKGISLIVPEWLKKLLNIPTETVKPKPTLPKGSTPTSTTSSPTSTSSTSSTSSTTSTTNATPATTNKSPIPPKTTNRSPIPPKPTPAPPKPTPSPPKTSSSSKIRTPWMDKDGKYNPKWKDSFKIKSMSNSAVKKSSILLDRVKEVFQKDGVKKGFEKLKAALPRLELPKVKLDSLKSLLSMATIKGVFKGGAGSLLKGGAGGGLPMLIADNLDRIEQVKDFRLWFQEETRDAFSDNDPLENAAMGKTQAGEGIGTPDYSMKHPFAPKDSKYHGILKDKPSYQAHPSLNNPISKAIAGASSSVQSWFANMQNGGGIFGAEGGILNEPVIGFGQNSGRKYTLGESGREAVVPLNKTGGQGLGGGTNITVNIQNMSGSQNDLNNLRKTILTVIQESSIGRVRA